MLRRVLATFGNGDCGRLGHGSELGELFPRILGALLDVQIKQVAAGGAHTAVVADDGSVFTFGLNDHGQLGHTVGTAHVPVPQEVLLPEPAIAVAAGHYHTLALTEEGHVWSWGSNDRGQLGLGIAAGNDPHGVAEPRLIASLKGSRITGIAAGAEHSLAVTSSGEVFTWGCADDGRLGHGVSGSSKLWQETDEDVPRVVRSLQTLNIREVAAGHMHSACVAHDDRLFMFGNGRFYQLGQGKDVSESKPLEVPSLRNVSRIACGGLHTLASLHSGSLSAWGANQHGVLGFGREGPQQARVPTSLKGLFADQVSAGWKHSAAITGNGKLYTWGWGGSQGTALMFQGGERGGGGGQLGLGDEFDYWQPTAVKELIVPDGQGVLPQDEDGGGDGLGGVWRVVQVACGMNHTAAVVEISSNVSL